MPHPLTDSEIQAQFKGLSGWTRKGKEIVRTFKFGDFKGAMAFVKRVAAAAESRDHHPDILIQYGSVKLTLSTHSAGGLTEMDFELARKINTF